MQRSPELETIIAGWFTAVNNGDPSWVDRYVSHQAATRLVDFDPDDVLSGEAAFAFLREQVLSLGGAIQVTPRHIEAYQAGDVGWGLSLVTITFPNGEHVLPRWSGVFHREGREWKLVQSHASLGIPSEELRAMMQQ
ncbi:hypothetical protein HRbin28_01665 [bacterium HR28]|jgi:ketosteroid isomerase-like protein|uniref:SnoaL-like domain-containing protein n=1 Tax=Thermomicrobium roseum TaxID=500 RepID=A0A7C1K3F4_THERO|nr:hypothetical protein HRbin28_01665 [bacterium HR28]